MPETFGATVALAILIAYFVFHRWRASPERWIIGGGVVGAVVGLVWSIVFDEPLAMFQGAFLDGLIAIVCS